MKRAIVLLILGFGLLAFGTMGGIRVLPASAQHAGHSMQACLDQCRKCHSVCEKTLAYCQKKGGKYADAKHVNIMKDCILACKTSADFLSRNSELHNFSCGFCAAICRACAKSCETFKDDKQMKECADECNRCSSSCEKMCKPSR